MSSLIPVGRSGVQLGQRGLDRVRDLDGRGARLLDDAEPDRRPPLYRVIVRSSSAPTATSATSESRTALVAVLRDDDRRRTPRA